MNAPNEKAAWWRPSYKPSDPNESSSTDDIKWGLGILFSLGLPVLVVLSVLALILFAFFQ
jgi:hypothetical protein